MPLGIRDITMVIRAKDNATRVFNQVAMGFGRMNSAAAAAVQKQLMAGAALMGLGVALGLIGVASLNAFNSMRKDAVEYDKQVALTMTQLDKVPATFEEIGAMGLRVAREIPVPLEEMQQGLYDIFSSMDVTAKGAERILTGFAKGAVAGQVDLQEAGRATIGIMNAWQLPAEEINRVMDVQFQLVRKGVGTYGEFASVLGRAIPAAVASGNSVEDLAGMMAFLTRNGLTTAQAATSAARAMELVASPKTQAKMDKMGITYKKANGEFLSMREILHQLAYDKGWAAMTAPERKKAFTDLFGTGSIQARRFFDVAIPGYEDLNSLTDDMFSSAGAMEAAYDTMFNRPASQSQLLENNIKALRIEIGQYLIPAGRMLTDVGLSIVRWFSDLSPGVKKALVGITAFSAVVATVGGIVLVVVGAFLTLGAAAAAVGLSMGAVIGIVAGITAAIIGIGAAIFGTVVHWDTLKEIAGPVWDTIKDGASEAWDILKSFGSWLKESFLGVWEDIVGIGSRLKEEFTDWWDETGVDGLERLKETAQGLIDTITNIPENVRDIGDAIGETEAGRSIIDGIKDAWKGVKDFASDAWDIIKDGASDVWDKLQDFWDWLTGEWIDAWHTFQDVLDNVVEWFGDLDDNVADFYRRLRDSDAMEEWGAKIDELETYMRDFRHEIGETATAVNEWAPEGDTMPGSLGTFTENIKAMPGAFENMIGMIGRNLAHLEGIWDFAWSEMSANVDRAWTDIKEAASSGWEALVETFNTWKEILLGGWGTFWSIMRWPIQTFINGVTTVWDGFWQTLYNIIQIPLNLIQGDWDEAWANMQLAFEGFMMIISGLLQMFVGMFTAPFAAAWGIVKAIWENGRTNVTLITSLLLSTIGNLLSAVWNIITAPFRTAINAVVKLFNWLYDILVGNSIVPDMINAIAKWFQRLPGLIIGTISNMVNQVVKWFTTMMQRGVSAIANGVGNVYSAMSRIGNAIKSAMPSLDILFSAGQRIIQGLIDGITSKIGGIASAMANAASTITSHWPFSPAKRGPLKTHPPEKAGRNIMNYLAAGMQARSGGPAEVVRRAMQDASDLMSMYTDSSGARTMGMIEGSHPVGGVTGAPIRPVTLNVERGAFEGAFPAVTDAEGVGDAIEEAFKSLLYELQKGTPAA